MTSTQATTGWWAGLRNARSGLVVVCALAMAACGGGNGSADGPAAATQASGSATVGASGGTVQGVDGASVAIPPDALKGDVVVTVAKSAVEVATPIGESFRPVSSYFTITPHGQGFGKPVQVSLPIDTTRVADGDTLVVLKAQPFGRWVVHSDVTRNGAMVTLPVRDFSVFVVATRAGTPKAPASAAAPDPFRFSITVTGTAPNLTVSYAFSGTRPVCLEGERVETTFMLKEEQTTFYTLSVDYRSRLLEQVTLTVPRLPTAGLPLTRMVHGVTQPITPLGGRWEGPGYTGSMTYQPAVRGRYTCDVEQLPSGAVSTVPWSQDAENQPPIDPYSSGIALLEDIADIQGLEGSTVHSRARVEILTALAPLARTRTFWEISRGSASGTSRWLQDSPATPVGLTQDGPAYANGSEAPYVVEGDLPPLQAGDNGAQVRLWACVATYSPTGVGSQYIETPVCAGGAWHSVKVLANPTAPTVTRSPLPTAVVAGTSATFSAEASGLPAPTLQWQRRDPGGDWVDIAGATANTYTLATTRGDDGAQFRAVASNTTGRATTALATLNVVDQAAAPAVLAVSGDLSVVRGGSAVFAATVGGTAPLSYQWRRNGVDVLGANSPILRLDDVADALAGGYVLEVSNPAGTVRTAALQLQVQPGGTAGATAPAIATQPANVNVSAGSTATFAVGVTGTGPFSFQWLKDGTPLAGANSAAYTIAAASAGDAGQYAVQVSSPTGAPVTSDAATLSVGAPAAGPATAPSIGTQPVGVVVYPGGSTTLAVAASGTGPLTYQWQRNGADVAGATRAVLTLAGIFSDSAGDYTVTVSNAAGSVVSATASVWLLGAPVITVAPAAAGAVEGATASFHVTAAGSALRYQWLRDGVALDGATGADLTTPVLGTADSGAVYSVLVYNGAGAVFSSGAVLTVTASPIGALARSPDGKLSALNAHACAVGADARAYCWGNGANGELGNGAAVFSSAPVRVAGLDNVAFVSAGGSGSCAIAGQGQLWCWGALTPAMTPGATPVAIEGVADARWVAVGTDHVCYVDANTQVLCWGDNSAGQLGDGSTTARSTPVRVLGPSGLLDGIVSVSAGSRYSCAVRDTGETWCWGADTLGQARPVAQRLQLDNVGQIIDHVAASPVGAGLHHACAINANNFAVSCWGANGGGQLGDGSLAGGDVAVDAGSFGRSRLAAGSSHTCALGNLDVVCWGTAAMGNGNPPQTLTTPQAAGKVASLSLQAHTVNAIAAGDRFTCALRTSGDVQCWGLNNAGQAGIGSTSDTVLVLTPTSTTAGAVFWKP